MVEHQADFGKVRDFTVGNILEFGYNILPNCPFSPGELVSGDQIWSQETSAATRKLATTLPIQFPKRGGQESLRNDVGICSRKGELVETGNVV